MVLELLLAHADGGQPVLRQGLSEETLHSPPRPGSEEIPERLWDESADPDVLPRQRWGIIAPEGPAGDRLLELIEPLRRLRQQAQGDKPVRIYRVPPGMDGPRAARWKKRILKDEATAELERPRYLLLLGDLDQVSLELQQVLATDAFPGRLCFATEAGYEAYVAKVLRWEGAAPAPAGARVLFYTSRDGTAATEIGYQALMAPSATACRERHQVGGFQASEILELLGEGDRAAEALLTRAAAPVPSMLLSMSHGLGPPKEGWASPERQRELQGALVLPGGDLLSASELAARPFLPGGVWFCFACFGAGTPAQSSYTHWLRQLPQTDPAASSALAAALPGAGQRPFVAALPQAALANPEGPLAVMGHVDLAWSYSFRDQGRSTPSRFLGVLEALAAGSRAGVAMGALMRHLNETSVELAELYNQEERARAAGLQPSMDPVARAYLWMLRQDLAGYMLLGDPAVRLPLAGTEQGFAQAAPPLDMLAAVGLAGFGAPAPAAPASEAAAEEAVIALLTGRLLPEDIAARHGVSSSELRRWEEAYRSAGRAALARLLAGR